MRVPSHVTGCCLAMILVFAATPRLTAHPGETFEVENGSVEVYLRYGTYSEPRRVFRNQALMNLTRTGYKPRPGNRVRVLRATNVFQAPFARYALAVGSVDLPAEGTVVEVMPYRRRVVLLGSYIGHEVWVRVRFPREAISSEVLVEEGDVSEDPREG